MAGMIPSDFPMLSQIGGPQKGRQPWNFREFWVITLVPTSFFLILLLLYESVFLSHKGTCIFFTIIATIVSISLVLLRSQGSSNLPIGINCCIATLVGVILGLYVFDTYGIFPQFYHNARKYTNVVPSESALAVADAGKLSFSSETRVMVANSMSFVSEAGTTYCVGPISDGKATFGSNAARVQFWAAGIDCCDGGAFTCDAAENKDAHGGIVVFDNLGWFGASRMDHYNQARKKAEAQFKLTSIMEPMFVRWVHESDLDWLENDYRNKAVGFTLVSILMYFGLSFAWALYMFKPAGPGGR